ncbi:MAG: NAD(P)-dependent oxidoreductase [Fibrobacter sp.]|uniref:NAD-dependent epimerase/dehydratase family protein n=1 Tax=unclassified Fibrobacter TaxID=2634177 RepID=UPI0009220201|nr:MULTISPECIES: NAD(P)-dependent oxidoreductase [unclassified Fibrobacter]MBO6136266.1 NAD(P)-dependent oxidoreductase [Fibrobacter sp.]MBR3852531.1 NAD(P)-dependent oxidoreductase [Fibrobacter sp.]MBR4007651.1 NAD(P)-dependent oxidoreductase [Fibrobacter sp.]SHH08098.1 UDP-glucose 4-epimerase [Fibrobacter sp. UWCM]
MGNNKKVVVLGATGTLGTNIAVYLKKQGYDVVAVGHRPNDNGFYALQGVPYLAIDVTNPDDFAKLPQSGVYAVLHFAGMLPAVMKGYNANLYISSIIQGTMNVLEYARQIKADRIVFPQSLFDVSYLFGSKVPIPADSIRKAPLKGDHAVYVIAKNAAVDLIQHYYEVYGLKRFILRLSRVYTYHPNPYTYRDGKKILVSDRFFIYQAMQGKDLEIWGDPHKLLETCAMRDFLQIVEKSLEANHDGGLYNIGSGGSTLQERVQAIADVFNPPNKKSKIIYCPEKPSARQFVLDIRKTVDELGYQPQCSWKDYLLDFKKEMEQQPFALLWGKESDYYTETN